MRTTFSKASRTASITAQNHLLNQVIMQAGLKNDAGLSRLLEVAPPVISKIRHGRLPIGATMAIAIIEETDFSMSQITDILSDQVPIRIYRP
ncbi:hypothetical protein ACO0LB_18555 [Undibacterium sp. SXout7W]|uniref:hypothetical protein n=1 Tax=Undibacterium sp. SXout7W TaxID=3413049 RepID=UPI003BEF6C7A